VTGRVWGRHPLVEGGGGRCISDGLLQPGWCRLASRPRMKCTVEVVRKSLQGGESAGSLSTTNGSSSGTGVQVLLTVCPTPPRASYQGACLTLILRLPGGGSGTNGLVHVHHPHGAPRGGGGGRGGGSRGGGMANVLHNSNGYREGEVEGELGGMSAGALGMPHSNPRGSRGMRGGVPRGSSGHAHRGAGGPVPRGCGGSAGAGTAGRKPAAGGAWPPEQEVGGAAAGQGAAARASGHKDQGASGGGVEGVTGLDDDSGNSDVGGVNPLIDNGQTDLDKRRDKRRRYAMYHVRHQAV
jgi:hypothetical protein